VQGGVSAPDEVVLLDWTKLELEERFTDEKLLTEMKDKPAPVTSVGPSSKVLVLQGLHHQLFKVEDAIKQALPDAEITALYERDEPQKQDLSQFGTLVLINYPLPPIALRYAIREWVRSGGHLLVCGGRYTLAQANWGSTFLEEVLPATLNTPPDVEKLPQGSVINQLPGHPAIYYAHRVQPRADARVLWSAGKTPILLQCDYGKGRVLLFTGTVLGEAANNEIPFWQWQGWPAALAHFIK
jgi:hypothetical protein